ncbi:hypothetical protein DHD80_09340 [Gramella sp. AN32]|nr:hypothetical protein [Gramella sp. AN32]
MFLLTVSCNKTKVADSSATDLDMEDRKELVETKAVEKSFYCFKKEFGDAFTSTRDIIEMNLEITNHLVEGNYNWLPMEKDRRLGTISAVLKDGIVNGTYISMQEGIADTSEIAFELLDKQVKFITNPLSISPENNELPRSDCR